MNRRQFAQTAVGTLAAAPLARPAKLAPVADGLRVGHRISPTFTDEDLAFFKNLGIEYATIWVNSDRCNYEYFSATNRKLEAAGIKLLNIGNLDLHCDPDMVLGLPGRDQKIEQYKQYLRDLGRAGIHYTTYAHMANIKMAPYYATDAVKRAGSRPAYSISIRRASSPMRMDASIRRNLGQLHSFHQSRHSSRRRSRCTNRSAS
jgi:hypothetical protein